MSNLISFPVKEKKFQTSPIKEVLSELKDIMEKFWETYKLIYHKYQNYYFEIKLPYDWLLISYGKVDALRMSIGVIGYLNSKEYEGMELSVQSFAKLQLELKKMKHLTEDLCSGVSNENLQQKIEEWKDLKSSIQELLDNSIVKLLIIIEVAWSLNLGIESE